MFQTRSVLLILIALALGVATGQSSDNFGWRPPARIEHFDWFAPNDTVKLSLPLPSEVEITNIEDVNLTGFPVDVLTSGFMSSTNEAEFYLSATTDTPVTIDRYSLELNGGQEQEYEFGRLVIAHADELTGQLRGDQFLNSASTVLAVLMHNEGPGPVELLSVEYLTQPVDSLDLWVAVADDATDHWNYVATTPFGPIRTFQPDAELEGFTAVPANSINTQVDAGQSAIVVLLPDSFPDWGTDTQFRFRALFTYRTEDGDVRRQGTPLIVRYQPVRRLGQ